MNYIETLGKQAAAVRREISTASTNQKNMALNEIADMLTANVEKIVAANDRDMEAAKASGMSSSLQGPASTG